METAFEGWWVPVIGGLVAVLSAVVTRGLYKAAAWIATKTEMNAAEKEATQVLLEGMALAQEELVREAKTASADGKLTKEEIAKAEQIAINYAKTIATGPAKDIILSWSTRRMSSLIKQLLANFKSKGVTNVSPAATTAAGPEITT